MTFALAVRLRAAIMPLLSIGAALGVTVAIFQHSSCGLLGVSPARSNHGPRLMLVGLSADYEAFSSPASTGGGPSPARARRPRLERTRHHAAAAIMICVVLSFVFESESVFKFFDLSLASVAVLCAFVLGSLLLPAVLELLGRRTWQPQRWLSRRPPKLQRYSPSEAAPAPETSS